MREFSPLQLKSRYSDTFSVVKACALFAKGSLRGLLIQHFPLAYEIIFTPGNTDESFFSLLAGHRSLVRLMQRPGPQELLKKHPKIIYRPYRRYLATSFTKKTRRETLLHHYGYLLPRMTEIFFREILGNHPQIWQRTIGPDRFSIMLSFPGELHHEGDLLLEFRQNELPLSSLSFSIAPGPSTGSTASAVILVARVQGVAGRFEAIRHATKACCDVSPCFLLMAAVQGISHALNVSVIAGVKNAEQITASLHDDARTVFFDYDAFWQAHLGTNHHKFFLMCVPISEKPIQRLSRSHRRRSLSKRHFKIGIIEMSKATFGTFCLDLNTSVSRAKTTATE